VQPKPKIDVLGELRAVLQIEIEGLQSVLENLNGDFVRAVELIASCTGQVFLTGIGKSGIIAGKIASTFRSTGTIASFLHPTEALHGDFGVVRSQDLVIALGKTGESAELNALLRIVRKAGTNIIAMTANTDSAMAGLADLVLELKIPREACPLNLAPTTSTTAMLAAGDALAVALMKVKNISAEDFARHHPGGQIGRRLLLLVKDVMRKGDENPTISHRSSSREMLYRITAFRVGAISVIDDDGRLLGLVTDYDVRRALESERNVLEMSIDQIMNASPIVVFEHTKAIEVLDLMRLRKKPTAVLPVVDREHRAVGMVHLHDLISAGL
jgi:arabinose-5-phosphate isomerase